MGTQDFRSLQEAYMEVYQLDELSDRTVNNALNARIAATGAAADRAYMHRNPEAMRAAEKAAEKEARIRGAVARRRERIARKQNVGEQVDLYDIILSHLLDEGYAETPEAAEAIMVNMSEEWREDIIDEGFKRMNRTKIEKQAERLGGDRGDILLNIASRMDTPAERKYSISQARRNRAGSGSYRQAKALQARDDAQADIEKYGLH